MLTTLFHLPARIAWGNGSLPSFGYGLALGVILIAGAIAAAWMATRHGWQAALTALGWPMALAALAVVFVLPALDDGQGVPGRGYGAMLLAAAAAAMRIGLPRWRSISPSASSKL